MSVQALSIDLAIESIVRQIVDAVNPVQIILIGSQAREDANEESDIDLLVIMPDGTHRLNTMAYLHSIISGIGRDFDIIVATEEDIREYGDSIGPIYRTILREGKVVYRV